MKVLGIDLESLGLDEDSKMIELACVPIDLKNKKIEHDLTFHTLIKVDSFEDMYESLSPWIRKNNKETIDEAHKYGIDLIEVKNNLTNYLNSKEIKDYFNNKKPVLFGKSLCGIDLPYLKRDFGWNWFRDHFNHYVKDVTDTALDLVVKGILEEGKTSSKDLIKLIKDKKDVDHRAVADIVDTAEIYWKLLELGSQL